MDKKRQGPQRLSWLRVAREARGLTQAELAREAGLSQVHLSRLENGRRERPSLATALSLADQVSVDPDLLFPRPGDPTPLDVLGKYLDQQNGNRSRQRRKAKP